MTVTVGRVRTDPVLALRFVVCGDNLVRGAAGAAIANAELLTIYLEAHPNRDLRHAAGRAS